MCVFCWQLQYLFQVPCYGFSLAVLIACQPDGLGFLSGFTQLSHQLLFLRVDDIIGLIIVLEIDADTIFAHALNVTNMTLRRHYLII